MQVDRLWTGLKLLMFKVCGVIDISTFPVLKGLISMKLNVL